MKADKRELTRNELLNAARDLVFERGHDRVSVQDITRRARLATGTYYNYFDCKQDVFIAVAESLKAELKDEIDTTRLTVKDPAMLVAVTLKFYFYQALDNRNWFDFTRYVGLADMTLQQDAEQCLEDINRGIKAGRFRVDDPQFTQVLIAGMVQHTTASIRQGIVGRNSIEFGVRSILQMLGLPDLVSKALTQTPLPALRAAKRSIQIRSTVLEEQMKGVTAIALWKGKAAEVRS